MYQLTYCLKEIEDAGHLQKITRQSEEEKRVAGIDYDEQHVRHSIVHAREDIILFVPLIAHILKQSKRTNRTLSIISALLAGLIVILFFK
ncbi:MAG: hypothetical protein V2A69_11465 [Pseudomonadota bacterium]